MHITRFDASHTDTWDAFVEDSRNGTLFHTRRFFQYHPADRFVDHSLLFQDDHPNTLAVLPAAEVEDDGKKWLVSHPGASYGGFVLSAKHGMKKTGEMVELLLSYAKEHGFDGVRLLRLTPDSLRKLPSDDQEYWLYQSDFHLVRAELGTALALPLHTSDVLQLFSGKCRNAVRKSQKEGVTVQETNDYASYWTILERSLGARHDAKPTHSLEEFQTLQALFPNRIRLTAAYDGDTMIAGVITVAVHDTALYTLYIAQEYDYQQYHPVHAIITAIAERCTAENISMLHFGISTEHGGTEVNDGLFFFKESFGGNSVTRGSWELVL